MPSPETTNADEVLMKVEWVDKDEELPAAEAFVEVGGVKVSAGVIWYAGAGIWFADNYGGTRTSHTNRDAARNALVQKMGKARHD